MILRRSIFLSMLFILMVIAISPVTQTQADTSFSLQKYTFSNGGGRLQSGNYALQGVIGQPSVVGSLNSSNYRLQAGYLAGLTVKAERYIFIPLVVR